jgi:L-ascorbate metabolism protein UlaG (beta-lactamase superfamily)
VLGAVGGVLLSAGVLGCCVFSGPRYRGPVTEHFDGKRFHSPLGNAEVGVSALLRWQLNKQQGPWREFTDAPPGPPPPQRLEAGKLRVTFVNHATALVQLGPLNLLTDPIWSDRASPVSFAGPHRVRPPGLRFEDLPPIDVVVLSHNHYDHLDLETLKRLEQRFQPRFFVGLGNRALLEGAGLARVTELDWWAGQEVAPGLTLSAVPAQHRSNRGLCDVDRTLWVGWVLRDASGSVFFAGDTGYGPHFAQIRDRFAPVRLSLLPIGAFRPEWFMAPAHLAPEEALRAHRVLQSTASVAIHFGTFSLADDGQDEAPARIAAALARGEGGDRGPFWVLGFGEGRDVP